ncbi:MAG: hypothetical protein QM479_13045 [Pseudomonadota bacterium]
MSQAAHNIATDIYHHQTTNVAQQIQQMMDSMGTALKDIEVGRNDESETSILNHHLDEIIYFFQETNYDAVVIEDLDRFGNPEIFVKLREINKLVNDNENTSGKIKFIYALKDDMFVHKKRAKFFDFIIPVVPIINSIIFNLNLL